MSRWRRGFAAVLAAAALAGCAGGGDAEREELGRGNKPFEGITISFVAADHPWTEAIMELLPQFEAQTGMQVSAESFFEDQLTQRLNVQFSSLSDTPDVFMHRPLQDGKLFLTNGWTEPLERYAREDAAYGFDDFSASAARSATVNGRLVGVPIITEQEILYYRKDLLSKAGIGVPKTIEELAAAAKRLHDPANGVYGFVARGQRSPLVTQVSSFLYSEGGDFTRGDRATINTPEAIRAFTEYGALLRDYSPAGMYNMSWPQAIGYFAQGKAAFYTDANSIYRHVTDPETSQVADRVGFAMFPAGKAGSKPYNITSWSLAINANSRNKEAAWAFIQWATSKEIVLKTQQQGIPGARNSVWQQPEGTAAFPAELVPIIQASAKVGIDHDRPTVIRVAEARQVVGELVQRVMIGHSGDLKQAADRANQALQDIMDRDKAP